MAKDFPDQLEVGPTSRLQLSYRFEPGSELDGVTLEVPESFVEQLHQEKLEWLVPGLLEEKLAALLKSLPKPLRRQFVPIPDTVKSLLPKMLDAASRSEQFWRSLCDICSKHIGQPVQRADFNPSSLHEHLRFRIELKDTKGNNLAVAREWTAIQQTAQVQLDSKAKTDRPTNATATNYPWQRSQMQAWDIPELPKKIIELNGGVRMERYPSLLWNDAKVSTTIYDLPHLAEQQLRETMVRSLAIQERRELKSQPVDLLDQIERHTHGDQQSSATVERCDGKRHTELRGDDRWDNRDDRKKRSPNVRDSQHHLLKVILGSLARPVAWYERPGIFQILRHLLGIEHDRCPKETEKEDQ